VTLPKPGERQPDRAARRLPAPLRSLTLRKRLLLSYSALAVLTLLLANGAVLALFARRAEQGARFDMEHGAVRLAGILENRAAQDLGRAPRHDLRALLDSSRRMARVLGDVMIVDSEGRVLAAGFRTSPSLREAVLPPIETRPGDDGGPRVQRVDVEPGLKVYYVSAALPAASSAWRSDLARAGGGEGADLHLVLARPVRELRGAWRSLVPAVLASGALSLSVAVGLAFVLSRSITRPVSQLTAASERLAAGDTSVRVPQRGNDELARLAGAFNSMAREVGQAQDRQRDFVANVGHDLRTPLTTVVGYAKALSDGTLDSDDERASAVRRIAAAGDRMQTMVAQLLELARLDSQASGLHIARCELRPLLDTVAKDLEPRADARRVGFEVRCDPDLAVSADQAWLRRAITNIADNAVRFSPEGGTVRLLVDASAPGVKIEVIDSGPGIPAADIERVFERFYRGDSARSAGNSGLGLSIAKEIVEAHGGTIEVAGGQGGGARVTLWLPAAMESPERA